MGRFVNPDNVAFSSAVKSEIYVDKTGLIDYTNRILGTTQAFICNSRPRRFGKSMTANMLSAYYSKGCDSHVLFDGLKISGFDSYDKNLNKYDVIHIDVQAFLSELGGEIDRLVSYISSSIVKELIEYYPNVIDGSSCSLFNAIASIYNKKGVRFIFIID